MKAQLNELVFYKIEMPSASSNKKIIFCIERIIEIINIISNANINCEENDKQLPNCNPNKSNNDADDHSKDDLKKAKFKDFNFYEVIELDFKYLFIEIIKIILIKILFKNKNWNYLQCNFLDV